MKRLVYLLCILTFIFSVYGQESDLEKYKRMASEDVGKWKQERDAEMDAYQERVEKERKEWKEYVNKVRGQWGEYTGSTPKAWAEYSNDLNALSVVDFENNYIEIATIVDTDNKAKSEAQIQKRFEEMLATKEEGSNRKLLAGQIKYEQKANFVKPIKKKVIVEKPINKDKKVYKAVTQENQKQFVKETVNKNLKKEVIIGDDGRARTKYTVTLEMVPNSIQVRAKKYMDLIEKYSKKYDLDPALVMALIHTESAFNPKAFSRRPDGTPMACGLMQIIPSQAGRDAHKALFGKDKIVEPEYLFDPEKNLAMGTWYVRWLTKWWNRIEKKKHGGKASSVTKNEYYTISSYNQGMGTILNKAYKPRDLFNKSDDETYSILVSDRSIPEEGRHYLERVKKRKKLYKK
ncbi:MAG: transglycosylase SLT domain-containing protein [Candidatus Delongbacteria bacterium]|jgi:membrane-bound lytic murein transglycosylase C|nr:transglycosylase SLT domain-containing protein [Candidatus Delongbacteria bacterium]